VYKLNRGIEPIYNNGQTEYAPSVAPGTSSLLGRFSIVTDQQVQQRLADWNQAIENGIKNQEFDCIISQTTDPFENYQITAEFAVPGSKLFIFTPNTKQP